VWTFYGLLRATPDVLGVYADIEEVMGEGLALSPEFSSALSLWRLFAVIGIIDIAASLVILAMQYAFAYSLWKPKRLARKVGTLSLGLGLVWSAGTLLATAAVFTALQPAIAEIGLQYDMGEIALPGITRVVWNAVVFSAGLWFLKKPEVRDYVEAEGYGYTEPTPPVVEEEMEPEPAPLEEAEVEPAAPILQVEPETGIPDTIKGKRPESVAWVAEDKCLGEIFLDKHNLIIVKSPDEPVIDIPIEDIVKLEQGKKSRYDADAFDALRAMGLVFTEDKVSKLKITYTTKLGQTSTVTLLMERKICPKCGGRMTLVAAGWYCKKDDHLIDPATYDLAQMIEYRRSQKTSKKDVVHR